MKIQLRPFQLTVRWRVVMLRDMSGNDPVSRRHSSRYGYATGQFGKNHLGDRDEFLPTNHGFDEFYGNLYHLNAEQEPEMPYWPKDDPEFLKAYNVRGVIHSYADGKIEDTGPLTMKRMETIDDETTDRAVGFIGEAGQGGQAVLRLDEYHPHACVYAYSA